MPSKPQSKESTQSDEVSFVLKHRIAGAGFLLFFGALVLPWLLGPPTEAFKVSEDPLIDTSPPSAVVEQLVEERDAQKELILQQEQVYISKITPLDRSSAGQSKNATNSTVKELSVKNESNGKAKLNDSQAVQEEAKKTIATVKLSQGSTKSVEGSTKSAEGSTKPAEGSAKPAKSAEKQAVVVSKSRAKDLVSSPKASESSKRVAPKTTSQVTSESKVDVGWVVQVGVFTDKRGAAKVVDDLRGKGFSPSTSIVDTNRGKATGTRIWLGPYAQRVEAAKAKSLLTSKTGEAGFIRAYP